MDFKRFPLRLLLMVSLLLGMMRPGWSHPMPSSAVLLHLGNQGVRAQLYLPIIELRLGWGKPLPMDAKAAARKYGQELKGYIRAHVHPVAPDGRFWTVTVDKVSPIVEQTPDLLVEISMTPPPGAPVDRFTFNYDVIFHQLITHTALVSVASDWRGGQLGGAPVLLATMRDTNASLLVDRSGGTWWRGFAGVFRMGERHLAEGTDHLLFLLALLLPAPLLAKGKRWGGYAGGKKALWNIVKVATSFTVGHSITLFLGAAGWVHLPGAFIESAIAVSIFVSAVHALAPIFRGKEIFIAGTFGLVHGLAFASTLSGFGFDCWTMASSVCAFNIGIEWVQLLLIGVTMPWLVLLARTPVYPFFRVAGASLTGISAASWFFERALGWPNPVGPVAQEIAARAVWLLAGLIGLSVLATVAARTREKRTATRPAG